MQVTQSVLEKMKWEYTTTANGTMIRTAIHNDELIAQKRVMFPENSKVRLMKKAMRGEYSLTNLEIKGTGNSYLIVGWENVDLFEDIDFPGLAA